MEEWERTLCENKAVAILQQMQEETGPSLKNVRKS